MRIGLFFYAGNGYNIYRTIEGGKKMGFLDYFHKPDIHQGLDEYKSTPGAVLLDVRTPEEYRQGHIPGSINVALQRIDNIEESLDKRDTPLYVYCHSGARSRQACSMLRDMGFTRVQNLGGIIAYNGKVES